MNDADRVRLMHMLEAAREALSFCEGPQQSGFDAQPHAPAFSGEEH